VSTEIAGKLQEVSGGSGSGETCTSFAECAAIINGGGVADYDGLSGGIAFGDNGDPTEAAIGIYQYLEDNTFEPIS
jgi:branched-chain amino acid transport system substrate-binding protein